MAEPTESPGTVGVTDHRVEPRGVLPRNFQTWLMAGLAAGILLVILLVGQPEPPAARTPAATTPQTPNADRVRDYQDRLRTLEAQALRDLQLADQGGVSSPAMYYDEPAQAPAEDPVEAERRRREYESLFASNVAVSRRPDNERPGGQTTRTSASAGEAGLPSVDEVVDSVMRATARAGGSPPTSQQARAEVPLASPQAGTTDTSGTPAFTGPIAASSAQHRLLEGTLIDTVLTNRLDGSSAAPVNLLVTNPLYTHSGHQIVIPAGARILGETRPVEALGASRLAVGLHRLILPDGRTYRLDHFMGLNQIGDAGLRDKVNHHYWSTFGAAGAVGLISGLAQWIGTAGLSRGDGNRTVIIAGGASDATAQASMQVMNRFLNRMPTVTIREGHRVKVYLTSDLELPAFQGGRRAGGF